MLPSDDERWVRAAQAGDRTAFERLVHRHADRLHGVVERLMGPGAEAEEVTQEAFLRAWRGIGGFHGEAAFSTWLHRIGVNEANRRLARRPSRPELPLDGHGVDVRSHRPGPARAAEQGDLRAALERAIAGLAPDLRAVIVLRDIEGLSTADAAHVLEVGEAALKSRLHRARRAVRAAVAAYLPEPGGE